MVLGKLFTSLLVPKPAVAPGNQALIIDILFLELNHLISISNVQEKILIYNTNSFHPPSPTSLPPPQPGCSTCQFDKEKQEKALPSQVPQPTQLGNLTRLYLTIVPSASIGPGYTCTSLKWPTWWTKLHTDFREYEIPPRTKDNNDEFIINQRSNDPQSYLKVIPSTGSDNQPASVSPHHFSCDLNSFGTKHHFFNINSHGLDGRVATSQISQEI